MSAHNLSIRLDDNTINKLKDIQQYIAEETGDQIGYGKVFMLYLDIVSGNIGMDTILLHYNMVKDTLLADKRKTRWDKAEE